MALPKNWPKEIRYLNSNEWKQPPALYTSPSATDKDILSYDANITGPCKLVRITRITDESHPAFPAYGLYSTAVIPAKTLILNYIGVVESEQEASQTSDYILHFDKEFSVDAEFAGNEGRFVNDFRGIGEKPNVKFELYKNKKGQVNMGIWSIAKIPKGTELLVTYGKGFWQQRGISFDHLYQ
ncbi:hypothetical protein HK103_007230 [Boothiomyces macroporosus]|uniref:SET domain-containing protein n=1 Tax=Boothiomyces macroporosus TaxID=261099 RepID=A0AAD5UG35_9FUNG|nr:hypothetical protein HK103_007230 [Boothiomyces macroporosus]